MSDSKETVLGPNQTVVVTPSEKIGDKIGHYKLLEQIGKGGFGIVYKAHQEEPVQRLVALKVVKLGMDTHEVIARFEAERQALALMEHPNIAKVFDAGATNAGRPYFVMEFVKGIPITNFCDENHLSPRERIELFITVCGAIQHAHQKAIIHRDIKPQNILVAFQDGKPMPKVIDFGIAKATQQRLTDKTVFTQAQQFVGTPAYMSPEQAAMTGLDIDTRSDIYSLGVLLYELLTGRTPFDSAELARAGFDGMRHLIREHEPAPPSNRITTMVGADLAEVERRRKLDSGKLVSLLRGDLDWIVMKALEKDRARRYESANIFALDIQRYLDNEPILARPPSNLYRFQKLVRRNKTAFAAIGAGLAALIFGLALSTYLFFQERAERKRAEAAEKEQERLRVKAEQVAALEARLRANAEIGAKYTQAGMLMSQGRFDDAERLMSQVQHIPAAAAIFTGLGRVHAVREEWAGAISNFTRIVEIAPGEPLGYHLLAPLYLQTGDVENYHRLRGLILQRFANTNDPIAAERLAKDCLIVAPPAADLPAIAKMADVAMAAAATNQASAKYSEFVKGLADYRQGNFADAVYLLQKVVAQDGPTFLQLQALFTLAMAQKQAGHDDEARATFQKATTTADAKLPKTIGGWNDVWDDWIRVQILKREATEMFKP